LGEETVRRVLPRPARATAIPTTFPEHDARRQRPNKPTRGTISGLGMVGVGEEDVSQYRMLSDHSIRGQYYQAGDIASTADVGGTLPTGWVPSNNVDPLDTPAVTAFWTAGFQPLGPVLNHWSFVTVAPPITAWIAVAGTASPTRRYSLSGLGVNLPPVLGYS
jgi:hypothetical protein